MKIGSIEVWPSTLIYALVLGLLLVVVPSVAFSRLGAIRESWNRSAIVNGYVEDGEAIDRAVAACQSQIALDPLHAAPRLNLGCLLARNKHYTEAQVAFDAIQDLPKVTDEEKSLALVGAALSASLDGSKDGKPVHLDEAERLAQKALGFKETPDALAALALVKSWKTGASDAEIDGLIRKALSAAPAPSMGLLIELYKLDGAIAARAHKSAEAAAAFRSVKALDPDNMQMEEAGRMALLGTITDPSTDPAGRRAAAEKMMNEIDKFGKAKLEAILAIGLAWHSFKGQPGYADAGGPYSKARNMFKMAMDSTPHDPRGFLDDVAMLEERIAENVAELTATVQGINGETTPPSAWDFAPEGTDTSRAGERYSKADQEHIKVMLACLRDEEEIWKRYFSTVHPGKAESIDAKTRQLSGIRRQIWLTDEAQSLQLAFLFKRAQELAADLVALDDGGQANYLQALILIDKGDLAAARAALLESKKRGFASADRDKLLASLDVKAKILDAGPNAAEHTFGAISLIRATVETPLGLSVMKNAKMFLNGTQVYPIIYGSQVLYNPRGADLTSATTIVRIVPGDVGGAPIEIPTFSFGIDKDPPEWSVDSKGGAAKGDVMVTVTLTDASGVDWASLNMGLRSGNGAGVPVEVSVIKAGHYVHALSTIGVKAGEAIMRSPFKIAAPSALEAGDYKVWIEVRDVVGNPLKSEKTFSVGK